MSDNTTQTLRSGELWPELQNNILNIAGMTKYRI